MKLIGHKEQMDQLRKAAKTGQLANAYLLSGPDGIGKRLAARMFAMELFCSSGEKAPCLECVPCQKVMHSTHPDVLEIDVEEEKRDITIEQMRTMQEKIQMHPLEGKHKIVIINNAERMNNNAANSALKSLEEPPAVTHFLIVTSRPHMLLPTILSRCQKLNFSPPPSIETVPYLKEKMNIDDRTAELLCSISSGSIGMALTFPIETMNDVIDSMKRVWNRSGPSEMLSIAERWSRPDVDHATILSVLVNIYKDIAVHQVGGRPTIFTNIAKDIAGEAEKTPPSSVNRKVHAVLSALNDIEGTYNKQLMFEQLLFTLASP